MPQRHLWLDSLRGLAALQVVLLHYLSALFPIAAAVAGIAHTPLDATFRNSPFFFLIDGYSAVYLFFLISGFVLGPAFSASTTPLPRLILSRAARLLLPVVLSAPLSLTAILAWQVLGPHAIAATGSHWLANLLNTPLDLAFLARDTLLNGTLLGYRGASIFGATEFLSPITWAINPPLWTLAYEVWGSLLLIVLCALLRPVPIPARAAIAAALIFFVTGSGELSLFLIGYIASLFPRRLPATGSGPALMLASFALLVLGIWLCVVKEFAPLAALNDLWRRITLYSALSEFHLASSVGAILIFLGLLLNPFLQQRLATRPLQALGRLSFSFYLLHFPLMLLVGLPAFLLALAFLPYPVAALIGTAIGLTVTFLVSRLFYRLDLWSMGVANSIKHRLRNV